MLKKSYCIAALMLATGFCLAEPETKIDAVAAYVNQYTITVSDVINSSQELQQALSRGPMVDKSRVNDAYTNALNALIDRKLILSAYEDQSKFEIPDSAFVERENMIIDNAFNGSRSDFLDALAAEHVTEEQWRANLRENSIVQAMRNLNVDSKVVISPLAAYERYQRDQDKYTTEPSVKISMMIIAKGKTDEDRDRQKAKMIKVLRAIKNGGDFHELAKEYSEDSYADKGGKRGWMKKDELRADIAKTAFASKVGAIRVVDLGAQYCILKIEDKVAAQRVPYSEARPLIEQDLRQEAAQKLYYAWIERLRKTSYIKVVANSFF